MLVITALVLTSYSLGQQSSAENSPTKSQPGVRAVSPAKEAPGDPSLRQPAGSADPALLPVRSLIEQGRLEEARKQLLQLTQLRPSDAAAKSLLGYVSFRLSQPEASLAAYTQAARLKAPTSPDLMIVAMDYVLLSDWQDAAHWFSYVAEQEPGNATALYYLGRTYYQMNRMQDAADAFTRVLALSPHDVRAETNLGLAFSGLNRPGEAMACFQKAIEWMRASTRKDAQPLIEMAIVLLDRGESAEALNLLLEAQSLAPDDARVHRQTARALSLENKWPQAETELRWLIAHDPQNAGDHFLLGRALRNQGKKVEAEAEFSTSRTLLGSHSSPQPQ